MIVVRFAPSPTGFLHIGGARTALFNWLYAKHTGGKFFLRIEDTDLLRSTDDAKRAITDGLEWLGLTWDDEVVLQSTRVKRHAEVAQQLLDLGEAYLCYSSTEEIESFRKEFPHQKFVSPWRTGAPPALGRQPVVRLRAPLVGDETLFDSVRGAVTVRNAELDDMVLLRADGTPTYMLAVVVDDYDMGVNMVIRGDDHFTNTFRQRKIYHALSWPTPNYAHVPMIHGDDGKKLSKRHGALGVEEYRRMGYLPQAMLNYLLHLGWSHGDLDIIHIDEAVKLFSLDGLGASPSRFDLDKLKNINAHYIKELTPQQVVDLLDCPSYDHDKLLAAAPLLQLRANTVLELVSGARIFQRKLVPATDEAAELIAQTDERVLALLKQGLASLDNWKALSISDLVKTIALKVEVKPAVIMRLLRALAVGDLVGPSIVEIMTILGKDEVLERVGA